MPGQRDPHHQTQLRGMSELSLSNTKGIMDEREQKYHIFWTIRRISPAPPPIWEENEGVSYSPNVAYLAGGGGSGSGGMVFFSYFPPLKPRYVLWSGASYSTKNTVKLNSSLPGFPLHSVKRHSIRVKTNQPMSRRARSFMAVSSGYVTSPGRAWTFTSIK